MVAALSYIVAQKLESPGAPTGCEFGAGLGGNELNALDGFTKPVSFVAAGLVAIRTLGA